MDVTNLERDMKINVFSIPTEELDALETKLRNRKMRVIKSVSLGRWRGDFYYSDEPITHPVKWAEPYKGSSAVCVGGVS
jgi:hypothetical protein